MALNSHGEPMNHRSRQQSMNAKRRHKNRQGDVLEKEDRVYYQ